MVLLIRAAVLAAIMMHRLEHVPTAGMGDGTALVAHSTAATAACRERATAAMLQKFREWTELFHTTIHTVWTQRLLQRMQSDDA